MSIRQVDLFIESEPKPGHDYLGYCGKQPDGTIKLCWKTAPTQLIRETRVEVQQVEKPKTEYWNWVLILAMCLIVGVLVRVSYRRKK